MRNILVSGSLAYDKIMDFPGLFRDHFMEGKLHTINVAFLIDTLSEKFGGTAGNIAYNLALLGEKPTILATAGPDIEREKKWLESHGVDCSAIHIIPGGVSATAYMITDKANNQIAAFYPGVAFTPYGTDIPAETASLAIVAPGCIDDMSAFTELYRAKGIRYFYDPGQVITALSADALQSGIAGAEALFLNDYELAMVVQKTGWNEAELVQRTGVVVVTLGEHGSRIITKMGEERVAAVPATTLVDPTGAGDAYRAGFIKGYVAGLPMRASAQLASTVAVFAVESYGTQEHAFTLDGIHQRYEKAYGESIEI
jgi:adenosine kinase